MGETRGGKSEIGSTIGFVYVKYFNQLFAEGHFNVKMLKDMIKEGVQLRPLVFSIDYVYDNQQVYKQKLKERNRNNDISFGQIHQIDEEKMSTGGIGSISDMLESENLNNIIAKFGQSEIWVKPLQLETKNCSFGLKVIKKDEVHRVNWSLLFRMEQEPTGATSFKFLGWVKIPLHHDEKFRQEYNLMKNEWIKKEISGRIDERMAQRTQTARLLVKSFPAYFEFNDKGRHKYSKDEHISLLDMLIESGKIDINFNYTEKLDIIIKARMMSEEIKGMTR